MEATKTPEDKNEGRSALRKKAKRFEQSRDKLKHRNSEKAATIKKLRDRLVEVEANRDHWRQKSKEIALEGKKLLDDTATELSRANNDASAIKAERDQLLQEVEVFKKKKKSRLFW